jgi:hypothetical protein
LEGGRNALQIVPGLSDCLLFHPPDIFLPQDPGLGKRFQDPQLD